MGPLSAAIDASSSSDNRYHTMGRLNIEELKQPQKKGFFGSFGLPEPVRRVANTWSNGLYAASMYAQQGLGYVSSFAWVFATAAVVIYLPLLRAMDSDRETIRAIRAEMVQKTAGMVPGAAPRGPDLGNLDISGLDFKIQL